MVYRNLHWFLSARIFELSYLNFLLNTQKKTWNCSIRIKQLQNVQSFFEGWKHDKSKHDVKFLLLFSLNNYINNYSDDEGEEDEDDDDDEEDGEDEDTEEKVEDEQNCINGLKDEGSPRKVRYTVYCMYYK